MTFVLRFRSALLTAVACLLGVSLTAQQSSVVSRAQTLAIVTADSAPVLLSPDPNRQPLRVFVKGATVSVVATEGTWLRVEFDDSNLGRRTGYVESRLVEVIRPSNRQPLQQSPQPSPAPPTATAPSSLPLSAATPSAVSARASSSGARAKTVHVREYTRKDGTKVKAHDRRPPQPKTTSTKRK